MYSTKKCILRKKMFKSTNLMISMPPLREEYGRGVHHSQITLFTTDTCGWFNLISSLYSILPPLMVKIYLIPKLRKFLYKEDHFSIKILFSPRGVFDLYGEKDEYVQDPYCYYRYILIKEDTERFIEFIYEQLVEENNRDIMIRLSIKNKILEEYPFRDLFLQMNVTIKGSLNKIRVITCNLPKSSDVIRGSKVAKFRKYLYDQNILTKRHLCK